MAGLRAYRRGPARVAVIGWKDLRSWSTQSSAGPVPRKASPEGPCCCGECGLHNQHEDTDKNLSEWLALRLAGNSRCNTDPPLAVCSGRLPAGTFVDSPRLVTSRCKSIEMQGRTRNRRASGSPHCVPRRGRVLCVASYLIRLGLGECLPVHLLVSGRRNTGRELSSSNVTVRNRKRRGLGKPETFTVPV